MPASTIRSRVIVLGRPLVVVLPADIITNIYRPVWGDVSTVFNARPITQRELELTSFGLADTLSFAQDRLHLTLGLRHQRVVQDSFFGPDSIPISCYDESALTPAAAVLFELTDQVSVYANYIEGLSQGGQRAVDGEQCR
ncbi:TonB-dependent receptor domain-containing protein [Oceanimonas baumannii]|uniref:TonB-dependent receptor domain-containing protein n=1 Tax=Oceanimonas baumannii TaxID=129578 RepID=UPI003A91F9CE